MEHDQEMHAQHGVHDDGYTIYPPDLHSYSTSSSSFMINSGSNRQRFLPSDAFGTPHRLDQHEAEHVYDSPQLTLDPSTLDLRSNSNENPRPPSANTSGSNNTTPTGSLRLSAYNLPNLSSTGVTTRRKARAALEHLQIEVQVGTHSEPQVQSPHHQHHQDQHQHEDQHQHQHQQSDMHDIPMHSGEMQMHVDEHHDHGMIGEGMIHEQGHNDAAAHTHHIYAMLSDSPQPGFYLHSDAFSNSPTSSSTPPDASPHSDMHTASPTSGLTPPSSSVAMGRAFRHGSLSLGIPASRSLPLITPQSSHGSPGQQQISPSHVQNPQLSSHPHMHPFPYYPLSHNTGSPGFPSTPNTSHHTQGSSSSSHSSGHTRYSFRGSPGPRAFGRGHARSNSYGTQSTVSVRSSSPASSVTSAFTSLSGGASGSAPASTSGPISPITYGEGGDVQTAFDTSPSDASHPRSQSHPPLSMPTAHPALTAYSALLPQARKNLIQQRVAGFMSHNGSRSIEESGESMTWPASHPVEYPSPSSGLRLTDEEFQAQFPPKPIVTRAPHRKQKLANSDRKAICLYAKQHPSARQEDIAARYNVERSTISKILKNKERWLGCSDDDAKVARKRKPRFDDLELVLKLWVEGTKPQGIILSDALIRSKAKEEARRLGILEDKFKASSGWLENFKHRVGIRKGKYIGRDPWPEASDSEGEESPLSAKHLHEQKMVWMSDTASRPEHMINGTWSDPTSNEHSHEIAKDEGIQASATQALNHNDPGQPNASGFDQGDEHSLDQPLVHSESHEQTSDPTPAMRQEGGRVGMRKTRSRTLAEAREAQAALAGGSCSPSNVASPATTIATVTVLTPAAHIEPNTRHGQAHDDSLSGVPLPPATSSSATSAPDGREVSAGLDAALDFIGCQPHGFATPEEVAVLKKLSRRMSRADLPRQHPASTIPLGWNETGET